MLTPSLKIQTPDNSVALKLIVEFEQPSKKHGHADSVVRQVNAHTTHQAANWTMNDTDTNAPNSSRKLALTSSAIVLIS